MTRNMNNRNINNKNTARTITIPPFTDRSRRLTVLGLCILSLILVFSLMVTPFYKISYYDIDGDLVESVVKGTDIFNERDISQYGDISLEGDLFTIEALIIFIAVVLLGILGACLVFGVARGYSAPDIKFFGSAQTVVIYTVFVTGAFYLASVLFSCIRNAGSATSQFEHTFGLPLWIAVAIAVFFAFLTRNITLIEENPKPKHTSTGARIELFFYAAVLSALAILAALGDILYITFDIEINDLYFNGLEAIKGMEEVSGGLQVLTFIVLVLVAVNGALLLVALCSLLGRSKMFYQISVVQITAGAITTFLIGLFGEYFAIAEEINAEIMGKWISYQLEKFNYFGSFVNFDDLGLTYEIQTPAYWFFFASLGVLCLCLLRKPYSRGMKGELIVAYGTAAAIDPLAYSEPIPDDSSAPAAPGDHDPCPAFTAIDSKYDTMRTELETTAGYSFENPNLGDIVNFVVNYARDSRLHLVYTPEDIAAFVAGLGTTRLSILQGMSGTGKTSLPKIFAEAILGECNLVEVESAWRDKNELLGYYNEFSRVYTPKKFTLALYRARLMPEIPTLIVLDEMNLSRIEYYFSDFLSLMENEEGRREIKLLGTPLYRRREGRRYRYIGLSDGTTVRIPSNVWFVGTANRDESTFEISDKVYDRAHTMNFNKRAPKVRSVGEPIPQRFISAETLCALFEEAKASVYFDIESSPVIGEVETLLAPYNISFGNRIANQIEDFVRIYAACFGSTERAIAEGLERILLSKVVFKLEFKSVVDKEELAAEFEKLGLARCSEFILSLNDD